MYYSTNINQPKSILHASKLHAHARWETKQSPSMTNKTDSQTTQGSDRVCEIGEGLLGFFGPVVVW